MSSNIFDLKGKVALITGGNSGIGLGFASGLAKAGADVVIWGRREANNRAAERALQLHGGRVASRVVDVAAETEVIEGMRAAVAEMGRLDCVVANAGFATQAPFTEMTAEVYHALLNVNLHGAFFTLREAAKHMVDRAGKGFGHAHTGRVLIADLRRNRMPDARERTETGEEAKERR